MGEKAAEFKILYSIYYTVSMYMFSKCYVGFCTPRRTQIDSKKKKKGFTVFRIIQDSFRTFSISFSIALAVAYFSTIQ